MFSEIIKLARPFWKRLALISLIIVVMSLLKQVDPLVTQQITDLIIDGKALNQKQFVLVLVGILLGVRLVRSLLNRVSWFMANMVATKLEVHLKEIGFRHLTTLSIDYFNQHSSGKLMSELDRGVNRIKSIINNSGMHFVPALVTALMSVVIVFNYEWKVATASVLAFVPFIAINRWRFNRNAKLEKQEYKLFDKQFGHFWEAISSMIVIKAFTAEKYEQTLLKKFFTKFINLRKAMEHNQNIALVGDLFMEVWNWGLFAYILWITIQGQVTVGIMVLLIQYTQMIQQPLWEINWIFWEIKRAQLGSKQLLRILKVKPTIVEIKNPIKLEMIKGTFVFKDVSFIYPQKQSEPEAALALDGAAPMQDKKTTAIKPVFNNLNLIIPSGKITALVGPSGSGKSTIAAMMLRYFDPDKGQIFLDGVNLKKLSKKNLRSNIGIVLQEPYLFSGSIKENLRYAKPNASLKEMEKACRVAQAHQFIQELPSGYDTEIGERGVLLSGGQKQRLSLARTILKNPAIIIFDEATSSLDSQSELLIQKALSTLLKGRTAVVIAHRLSTVRRADQIVVLKEGQIHEQGNHQQLIDQDGLYAQLFKIQSGDPQTLKEWGLVG